MIANVQLGVFVSGARVLLSHVHAQHRAHNSHNKSEAKQREENVNMINLLTTWKSLLCPESQTSLELTFISTCNTWFIIYRVNSASYNVHVFCNYALRFPIESSWNYCEQRLISRRSRSKRHNVSKTLSDHLPLWYLMAWLNLVHWLNLWDEGIPIHLPNGV